MDELLKKAAELKGLPAMLVERSAKARAEETGQTVEEVLAEWVGEDAPAAEAPVEIEPADSTPAADSGDTAPPVATPSARDAVPSEITDDYLVKLAAEARRMPEKLVRTSAEARAKHSNVALEIVLADWAGVDLNDLREQAAAAPQAATAPAAEPAPAPAPEPEAPAEPKAEAPAAAPAAAAAVAAMSLDEVLDKASEARGLPSSLTKRSAEARAKESGQSLEEVLAEWAGVPASAVASGDAAPAAPAPAATAPDAVIEAEAPAEEPAGEVEVIEAETGTTDEDSHEIEKPAKAGRYPAWLAAAFLIIPLLAVTYILVSPNGPDCGVGGQLLIDPVSGEAVNCDGSAYGTVVVDHFANGAAVYAQCTACHAANGTGGAGPAFVGGELLSTFPAGSCSDQAEWITLGTSGWPDSTYGATAKPVGGGGQMPGFGTTLTEDQIAEVALYERVQFGGQDLAQAEEDCGFGHDEEDAEATDTDGSTEASG